MSDIAKTTFVFLRHGEPVGGRIFRGSHDDPLTDLGWIQLKKSVANVLFDEIVSSPLKRCAEFAQLLHEKSGIPLNIDNNLKEMHLGDWEGLSVAQVNKRDAKALAAFWKAPHKNTPVNGEPFPNFEQRVLGAWERLNKKYTSTKQSKKVLVVCHAGVMMVLLKEWLKIPLENILCIKLNYASKIHVDVFHESYKLKPQIYIEHGYEL